MKEARFYNKLDNMKSGCFLCPHNCIISEGNRGICRVRENRGGTLYSLVYGKLVSASADPVEKKPLFHFQPGTRAFSIATAGCNFHCLHCQNSSISQVKGGHIPGEGAEPENIVDAAIRSGCSSIAYTYTEPTIYYEFAADIAAIAKKKGLKNIFVTNGFISQEPLKQISPVLDAANIDLKTFDNETSKRLCGAPIRPVLDNIKRYYDLGIWIELTTLIIPGINDSCEELQNIADFIKSISPSIPWHLTAFHPACRLNDIPPTSPDILNRAVDIGNRAGLEFVYHGNIGSGEDTFCPGCSKLLIKRSGLTMRNNKTINGKCPFCGTRISGFEI